MIVKKILIFILFQFCFITKSFAVDFFTEQKKTFINYYGVEEEYIYKQLTPKYQKFVDKNGRILNIKELNKNGKYIFFENEDDKNDYYVILEATLGTNKKTNKTVCSIYAYCNKDVYDFLYYLHAEDGVGDDRGYRFEVKLNLENFTYSKNIKLLDKYKNISKEEEQRYNYDLIRSDTIYDSDIKKVEWDTYSYNNLKEKLIELLVNIEKI